MPRRRPGPTSSEQLGFELPPRRAQPETSRRARRGTPRAVARRTQMQDAIVEAIDLVCRAGDPGVSATALHTLVGGRFGVDLYEVRRRVSDLRAAGVLVDSGRRALTGLGAREILWALAPGASARGER